jgi:hypothetical protein
LVLLGCSRAERPARPGGPPANDRSNLSAYLKHLAAHETPPVDYLVALAARADLILLGTRDDREISQAELIGEVARDRRFTDRVGAIFLEGISREERARVKGYLDPSLSEARAVELLRAIWLERNYRPVPDRRLPLEILRRLRGTSVPVVPIDIDFQWEGASAGSYAALRATLPKRQESLAAEIADRFDDLRESKQTGKRALVILDSSLAQNAELTVGRFLFERNPGRVANVLMHGLPARPMAEGRWDAAFAAVGNPDRGFDLSGTVFGEDEPAFTGLVFFRPCAKHLLVTGNPELAGEGLDSLVRDRLTFAEGEAPDEEIVSEAVDTLSRRMKYSYENQGELEAAIRQWRAR